MKLGFDFDNTIVCYDQVFHKVAVEKGVIDDNIPVSKVAVRDKLRENNIEDVWTEIQGYVYGARMADALPYPNVLDVLKWARKQKLTLYIISHKTKHPFLGFKYDLHKAAKQWIDEVLRDEEGSLILPENVYFLEDKSDKVDAIGRLGCQIFIDDLPEILTHKNFSEDIQPVLFDPENNHPDMSVAIRIQSWKEIPGIIPGL